MISDVKRIKLMELEKQRNEYEEIKAKITQKLEAKSNIVSALETEIYKGITVRSRFTFIQKWITKRDEYRKYQEQVQRYRELPRMLDEAIREREGVKKITQEELEVSGVVFKIKEIEQKIATCRYANTLYDIGVSPEAAIKLLEDNGITPVLTEEDKQIFEHPRNYTSKSSLIGVHKTKYPPVGNVIKSAKDANVKYERTATIDGKEYTYTYRAARDTIHMAMNDEVSSHAYGSWEECEYAILVPFEDIPNEKVGRLAPMDTFTKGSLELSQNSWILCPQKEVEKIKQNNPTVNVIGYDGKNVKGFAKPFLTQLGYRGESVGMWDWGDEKSSSDFRKLRDAENLRGGAHSYTYFHSDEEVLANINMAVSLCKFLRDKRLIRTPEDIKRINSQLKDRSEGFDYILGDMCRQETDEIGEDSIVGNNRHSTIFIEEMRKNGFEIPNAYQSVIKRMCEVSLAECSNENKEYVFEVCGDATEKERETIKTLASEVTQRHEYYYKTIGWGNFISMVLGESILNSREREVSRGE